MIRSLRLRFFLITWPLIVLTVAMVALAFDRWTVVTLTEERRVPAIPPAGAGRVDSAAAAWANGGTAAALTLALADIARTDSLDAIVLDTSGAVIAISDSSIRRRGPANGELVEFERTAVERGMVAQQVATLSGFPLRDSAGAVRGRVFRFPRERPEPGLGPAADLRANARRTIWIAVLVASGVAALLALLLSGPLARQIGRLARAAERVRGGDLAARVAVTSRDELGKLEASFNEMSASLARADQHKRHLAHDVAHELRTPLTNVIGIIEAMQDGLRAPDSATLATLRAEAGLLAALVSDLQELSLAESGQLPFDLTEVDVTAEATMAVDAMRDASGGVGLVAPSGPAVYARADQRRLGQVLRNLLRNAITHTPPAGTVAVEVAAQGGEALIAVTDTGRGIPAEHLELIWERLHRVDPARSRAAGGHGLGLAIVKQFVEGMGGRVAVSSEPGRGSRFEVRLPKAADPPGARTPPDSAG